MPHRTRTAAIVLAGLGLALATPRSASAQQEEEQKELGWFFNAELSLVMAAGNAESTTFGAGAAARREWERARWKLEAGGLRTESAEITRRAVGTADDFDVEKESDSELTAENYYLRSRLDRSFSESAFVYGGASWVRNTFTGIDSRFTLVAGSGLTVSETVRGAFRVDLGGTYTVENPVAEGEDERSFAGLRFSWDYGRKLTESTTFSSVLVLDENLKDTDDLRGDFTNAISVSISEALALRTSLQLLYDNQPSLTSVPLFTPDGDPTGETVLAELDELDSLLTVAIVFSF